MFKEDVEKQQIKDEADVFCDNDQVEVIMNDMNTILSALKEWRQNIIYFCENGMQITRLSAAYSVQLVMDVVCKVLDDYQKLGLEMSLKKEQVEFLEHLGEEK